MKITAIDKGRTGKPKYGHIVEAFCCESLEKAWNDWFVFGWPEENLQPYTDVSICRYIGDELDIIDIFYCPFCGKEIQIEIDAYNK